MKRLVSGLLVVALGLSVASRVQAYSGTYPAGTGINGTVHDLGTAHNGMNYVAIADGSPQADLHLLPRPAQHLSTEHGHGRRRATGAGRLRLPAPVEPQLQANYNYTMYENGPGAPTQGAKASQAILDGMTPGSTSLLCLSCHDGSVAVNRTATSTSRLRASRAAG